MSKDDFSMSLAAGETMARMREHMEKQLFDPNLNGYGTSFGNNWVGQGQQGLGLTDAAQAMQQAYGAGGGGGGQLGQGGFNIKPGGGVRVQTGQSRPAPKPESVITTDSTGDIHRVMIDGAAVMETSDPAEAREIAGKLEALGIGMADPLMSKMGFAPVVAGIDPASGIQYVAAGGRKTVSLSPAEREMARAMFPNDTDPDFTYAKAKIAAIEGMQNARPGTATNEWAGSPKNIKYFAKPEDDPLDSFAARPESGEPAINNFQKLKRLVAELNPFRL